MLLRPVSRGYNLSVRSFLRMWHDSELVGSGIQRSWIKPMSRKCIAPDWVPKSSRHSGGGPGRLETRTWFRYSCGVPKNYFQRTWPQY
jgi:hypothetical protein